MKYKYHQFSNKHITKDGLFGLELEVEATGKISETAPPSWSVKTDDSLRYQAREYVTAGPIGSKEVDTTISSLIDHIRKNSSGLLEDSPRTSFHVHVNNYDLTPKQLINFAYLYWLVEPSLVNFCGPKRKGNLFCLRVQDAEEIFLNFSSYIKSRNPYLCRNSNEYKYAGLNLTPNARLGTAEFRCMAGDLDAERLIAWVRTLESIRTESFNFNSPDEISNAFYRSDKNEFIRRLFHPMYFDTTKYTEEDLIQNQAMLSAFAHSFKWDQTFDSIDKEIEVVYLPYFVNRGIKPRTRSLYDPATMNLIRGDNFNE